MLKLQTPVDCGHSRIGISYEDKILVIGSCFADNIGQKMQQAGFDVCVNPFGTLYNPMSLKQALERLASGEHFSLDDCVAMGAGADKVCSFWHHTSFARDTEEDFLSNANAALDTAHNFYKYCNKVILTLGTSFCYTHNGNIVSNCLKRPAAEFNRYMLQAPETESVLTDVIGKNNKQFIITVSPIRHMADGAAANQLSKSSLIVAAANACHQNPGKAEYFPAYEIVMDELRDYRFYAEDLVHPTAQTINYLWERFTDFALPAAQKEKLLAAEKLFRQSQHRQITF